MAKAILEFDLNEPDDRMAHIRAVKSLDMASFIFELTLNTKKQLEHELASYEFKNIELKDYEVLNMVFKKIYELADEHGINIDDLIN
jgi:hypothetical protein